MVVRHGPSLQVGEMSELVEAEPVVIKPRRGVYRWRSIPSHSPDNTPRGYM